MRCITDIKKLTEMSGDLIALPVDELIKKIFDGERDFSYTRLIPGSDISTHPDFLALQDYLQKQFAHTPLESDRLNFSYAELRYARMRGVHMPYMQVYHADLGNAVFDEAILDRGRFLRTYAGGISLRDARLTRTAFHYTALDGADITGAMVTEADFSSASIQGIKGLASVREIGAAYFSEGELPAALQEEYRAALLRLKRKKRGFFAPLTS